MERVRTDTKDVRTRVHLRVLTMDGVELLAYGKDVAILPDDAERRLQDILADHPLRDYPEGALVATFASGDLRDPTTRSIRDPREILSDPYPWNIRLSEFPPEEGQLCKW